MMYIICDKNNVVQDISTRKENLARGYTFTDYKLYEDVDVQDMRIGDTFKDNVLTKNQILRQGRIQQQAQEEKIQTMQRKLAIKQLKIDGELPSGFSEK